MLAFFVRHATKPSHTPEQNTDWPPVGEASALPICEPNGKTAFLHHAAEKLPILSVDVSKKYLFAAMHDYLFDGDLYANNDRVTLQTAKFAQRAGSGARADPELQ